MNVYEKMTKLSNVNAEIGVFNSELRSGQISFPTKKGNPGDTMVFTESGQMIFVNETGVSPELFGAVGDGVTDDTVAVQAALDSGSQCVKLSKKYLIGRIFVNDNTTLCGGGTIIARAGPAFSYPNYLITSKNMTDVDIYLNPSVYANNIIIDGLVFETQNLDHGIVAFVKINNCAIVNCLFNLKRYRRTLNSTYGVIINALGANFSLPNFGVNGPGPNLYEMPVPFETSKNILFHQNTLIGCEFNCDSCENLVISSNLAVDCYIPYGVNTYNRYISIVNNVARYTLENFPVVELDCCGIYLGQGVFCCSVVGNVIHNPATYGIYIESVSHVTVQGNTFTNDNYLTDRTTAIQLSSTELWAAPMPSSYINISNNIIRRFGLGISAGGTYGTIDNSYENQTQLYLTISNNDIECQNYAFGDAIYLAHSRFTTINNNVCNNGGIVSNNCSDITLANNIINAKNTAYGAIWLLGTPYSGPAPHTYPLLNNTSLENNYITNSDKIGNYLRLSCIPTSNGIDAKKVSVTFGPTDLSQLVFTEFGATSTHVSGQLHYSEESIDHTALSLDVKRLISYCDASTNNVIVTLPDGLFTGQIKKIVQILGSNVTQITAISGFVDSSFIYTIQHKGKCLELMWTGTQWTILGSTTKETNNRAAIIVNSNVDLSLDFNSTVIDSTSGILALTLNSSAKDGDSIKVFHTVGANNAVLTPAAFGDGTTITTVAPASYELVFITGQWRLISNVGAVIA